MHILKLIVLTICGLVKQVCSIPHAVMMARQHRRERVVRDEREIERLDRIRNPSKYLGK
jgi:hypothetical protein